MGTYYSILKKLFSKPMSESQTLFTAVSKNDFQTLEKWMQFGADVCLRNDDGLTLLHMAAEMGHEECVRTLLKNNAVDVNCRDSTQTPVGLFQTTPLHLAASEGWPNIVALLLDSGADIDAANVIGWTPLHYMIVSESITIANLDSLCILIEWGADVNRRDRVGNLPIETAILYGHYDVTRVLLNNGIDAQSLNSIDPNLMDRDEVFRCVRLCVTAGCYNVIDKYDVIKFIIDGSAHDEHSECLVRRIDSLLDLKLSAQSLKYMCRIAIRRRLSRHRIASALNHFNLPHLLRLYLLLEE